MGMGEWTRGPTIGRGATATVSLATSSHSGEVFAVKSAELACSGLLQREQSILSALDSPHVISYRGFEVTAEAPGRRPCYNLFMEYAAGGSLSDRIRKQGRRLDEPAIRAHAHDVLCGLADLHASGIAHCDIKGQNVLIGSDGRAKIADLGCARRVADDGTGGPMRGTPRFMAPEVARGEEQGPPADLWALGCTVIEMATGRPPWPDVSDPVAALRRIAFSSDVPEFRSCVSGEGRDFLSKCLKRDPKERWTAGELLKHPFVAAATAHWAPDSDLDPWIWVSPKSTLDQGMWESSAECPSDDPADRIRQLVGGCSGGVSSSSPAANWTWDADWVTLRSNDSERTIVQIPDDEDRSPVDETAAAGGGGGEGNLIGTSGTEELVFHTNRMDADVDFFSNAPVDGSLSSYSVEGVLFGCGIVVNCNTSGDSIYHKQRILTFCFTIVFVSSIVMCLFSLFLRARIKISNFKSIPKLRNRNIFLPYFAKYRVFGGGGPMLLEKKDTDFKMHISFRSAINMTKPYSDSKFVLYTDGVRACVRSLKKH